MDYKNKYLKYKQKYFNLKYGGDGKECNKNDTTPQCQQDEHCVFDDYKPHNFKTSRSIEKVSDISIYKCRKPENIKCTTQNPNTTYYTSKCPENYECKGINILGLQTNLIQKCKKSENVKKTN